MHASSASLRCGRLSPGASFLVRGFRDRRRAPCHVASARLASQADVSSDEAARRGERVADANLTPGARGFADDGDVPRSVADDGKVALKAMRFEEVEAYLESIGERPGRASQLFGHMYRRGKFTERVRDMADVSAAFRDKLARRATFDGDLELESVKLATDGTRKILYRLKNGGGVVESVLIPSETDGTGRTTVCVSSQLGCAMNCQFCYTAKMGLRRNLTTSQIVEQIVHAKRMAESEDPRAAPVVTNVVFMGMGEPLHNIDAVLAAVDILTDPRGLALSHNKVTVSTSGLVPEMERYLRESRGSLAVSLSATTDEIRSWIMPINRKYNLERLIGALAEHFPRKGAGRHQRQVFFEYIMLAGVNDSSEDADRLLDIAKRVPCKFNLIYFNTHEGSEFRCSDAGTIEAFRERLTAGGAACTIRRSRGDEEMAACGQLGSPDAPEDWKPAPPRMRKPRRLREAEEGAAEGAGGSETVAASARG